MKKTFSLFLMLYCISFVYGQNVIMPDTIFKVYDSVDVQPAYKPGTFKFISAYIKYPSIAYESGFEGKVIVKFYVDIDGSIKEPVIIRNDGCVECADEVLKVIKSFPKWTPGYKDGLPVRTYFTLPVTFSLNDGNDLNTRSAIFKGGDDKLESYINSTGINIKATTKLINKNNNKYTTLVKFKVLEDGSVDEQTIISTNINDESAIDKIKIAISKMLWYPAIKEGKVITSFKEITFTF